MPEEKRWNAKLIFEVDGGEGEIYRNTSEWIQTSPNKVRIMENLLGKVQAEFVEQASSV